MRIDFIFSYWIFFWYVLYIFGLFTQYNPKFAIITGLIENMVILLFMFFYNTSIKLIILFAVMSTILKLIPLYTIWNSKIKSADIGFSFLLFFIYLFWTHIHNLKFSDFLKRTSNLIIHNKNTLPGMQFLDRLQRPKTLV